MNPSPESGIVTIPTHHSVDLTVETLEAILQAKGVKLFALVDHSGEAERAGMQMRPSKLLIFGNPRAGTPPMIASPSAAIDLPLKVLVWEDAEGKTWISYNSAQYLQAPAGPASLTPGIAPEYSGCRSTDCPGRGMNVACLIPHTGPSVATQLREVRMRTRIFAGLLGAGMVFAMVASAQTPDKEGATSKDMREAIAFERNKDAADARQVRLEATHRNGADSKTTGSADRSMDDSAQAQTVSEQKPVIEGMRQAIAFERAKDAADARQARLEARHPSVTNSNANRSADRTDESTPERTVKDPGPKK